MPTRRVSTKHIPRGSLLRTSLIDVCFSYIGYVYTYIVLPSTIYGIATGRLVDLGIQNPYSIQIPALIKAGIDRGHAGLVGKGDNLWPNVHIDDSMYLSL